MARVWISGVLENVEIVRILVRSTDRHCGTIESSGRSGTSYKSRKRERERGPSTPRLPTSLPKRGAMTLEDLQFFFSQCMGSSADHLYAVGAVYGWDVLGIYSIDRMAKYRYRIICLIQPSPFSEQ